MLGLHDIRYVVGMLAGSEDASWTTQMRVTEWNFHPTSMRLGRSAYEKSFGIRFVEEEHVVPSSDYVFRTRVIPKSLPYGFPSHLRGKSVAVVGNGEVKGCGFAIDGADEVIRISSMRNWRKNQYDDGLRTTLWAGQLAFIIDGERSNPCFAELVAQGTPVWTLSPFHITCDAFLWLRTWSTVLQVLILLSSSVLSDIYHQ